MLARLVTALLIALPGGALAETRLLMLDQPACGYCAQWDAEVGVIYHKTAEGRRAPLLRAPIAGPLPQGVTLARRANYTPTFVVLLDGQEAGRIEGYPGEAFFYGMLNQIIDRIDDSNDQ